MAAEDASALKTRFVARVNQLRRVRDFGMAAYRDGSVRQSVLDHIFESTFLDVISSFDVFLEELFYSAIVGASGIREVVSRVSFGNRAEAERFVLAGERSGFLSWARMRDNITRAELFLHRGRPFSRLKRRPRDLELLGIGVTIRNAIAHESRLARRKFLGLPLGGLAPNRRNPAGYLQQAVGSIPQHENLFAEIVRIASALAAENDSQARRFLRDEAPYASGERADRGTYRCKGCGVQFQHTASQQELRVCLACHPGPCSACGSSSKSTFQRVYS